MSLQVDALGCEDAAMLLGPADAPAAMGQAVGSHTPCGISGAWGPPGGM